MKKFFLFFFSPLFLFALYQGNPALPELPEDGILISKEAWLGIKVGYQGDRLFYQKFRPKERGEGPKTRVEGYCATAGQGVLTFNINDRLEFYGSVGSMRQKITLQQRNRLLLKCETDDHFLWGGGMRLILFHWQDTVLGVDVKYAQSQGAIQWLTREGINIPASGDHIKYHEWQAGVGFAYEIDFLIPYATIKYDHSRFTLQGGGFFPLEKAFRNEYTVGISLGCSFSRERLFVIDLEARLINERALSFTMNFRL